VWRQLRYAAHETATLLLALHRPFLIPRRTLMSANQNSQAQTRRRWLQHAALLSAGGAIFTSTGDAQDTAEERAARDRFLTSGCRETECPHVLKLSKNLEDEIRFVPAKPCHCTCNEAQQVIGRACYRSILKLQTNADCDETEREPLLQFGAELWLSGKMTLREAKCKESGMPVLVGVNEGMFRIHRYKPNEDVFAGPFCGTVGLMPVASGGGRCCAATHGIGTFHGAGFNKLDGWSLCTNYHFEIEGLGDKAEALCMERTLRIKMHLDGVLVGPCERIAD
jgi:hypothetical protein